MGMQYYSIKLVSIFFQLLISLIFHIIWLFLAVTILIPSFFYRLLIFRLAQKFRPDLKIISVASTPYAFSRKNPRFSEILSETRFDKRLNIEEFKEDFRERILNARDDNNGELLYPELRQILTFWCGYYFWKYADNFNLDNHIKLWTKSKWSTDEDLNQIRKDILIENFVQGDPWWTIYMIENTNSSQSVGFLKHNHLYGDAISLFKCSLRMLDNYDIVRRTIKERAEQLNRRKPLLGKSEKLQNVVKSIVKILKTPFRIGGIILDFVQIKNAWRALPGLDENSDNTKAENILISESEGILVSKLKQISTRWGVSVFAVVLAGIFGGIRNYMEQNGNNIPEEALFGTVLSKPHHPDDKLTNHAFGVFVKLPIGGPSERVERLQAIQTRIQSLIHDSFIVPYLMFIFGTFLCLPRFIYEYWLDFTVHQGMSNFPSPFTCLYSGLPLCKMPIQYRGYGVRFGGFLLGSLGGVLPISLSSVSSDKEMTLMARGLKSVFKDEESLRKILRLIEEEYDLLLIEKEHEKQA